MIIGKYEKKPWMYLRTECKHNWYVDARHPTVGFVSRDEAALLYNLSLARNAERVLEIGVWKGWSACHIALSGAKVDAIDPLLADPVHRRHVESSLWLAGVRDRVHLHPGRSPQTVRQLAEDGLRWGLIFIDGDHDGRAPLVDALVAEEYSNESTWIVFHDLASPDVASALFALKNRGWQIRVYETHQVMGIAWKSGAAPLMHVADEKLGVALPRHLR
jgi:predicted O-methyltransferase YrrM